MDKRLTKEAQADRNDFEWEFLGTGCNCGVVRAPCSWCTHPGNPINQEDDIYWEDVTPDYDNIWNQTMGIKK